jgi:GNAT superfamily N-acetyltransferase
MRIRQATLKEGLLLSALSMDGQGLHAGNHPDVFRMPRSSEFAAAFFDALLIDPAAQVYIAEENEQAFGYIVCKIVERSETPFTYAMRYLLVDQISVRPEMQSKGVGRALMEQAEVFAKQMNITRMQLDSWAFNTKAHEFFEAMGFKKFYYRFWRDP